MADLEVSVLPMRAVHMCHLLLKAGLSCGPPGYMRPRLPFAKRRRPRCCIAYQSTPFAACMTVCGASGHCNMRCCTTLASASLPASMMPSPVCEGLYLQQRRGRLLQPVRIRRAAGKSGRIVKAFRPSPLAI